MKYNYDMIVIGAGAAGLTSAVGAAGIGAKVLLIEAEKFGGDCTHYGCVPSKALIHAARIVADDKRRVDLGLPEAKTGAIDVQEVLTRVDYVVRDIEEQFDSIETLEAAGVEVCQGWAYFEDENTVLVTPTEGGEKKSYTAKKFVIATGARPRMLPESVCPSDVTVHTNRSIFNPRSMSSLAVIGSGPIGIELAQAFARLGVEVTVITRDDRILARDDEEVSRVVARALKEDGVRVVYGANLSRIQNSKKSKEIIYTVGEDEKEQGLEMDELLVAIGRTPNVEGLGLEEVGVTYDPNRGVEVNPRAQTDMPHIYAVGDVASQWKFTHYAGHMAKVMLAHSLLHIPSVRVEERVIPRVTFTDPEVASVGITEYDLKDKKPESYHILSKDYAHVDRAITDDSEDGFVRIIVDRKGQILGATIVGPSAGELIGEVALAMKHKISISGLADTIHAYPTYGYGLRHCADQFRGLQYTEKRKQWVKKIFGLNGK